jgi:hypothetical protein
MVAVAAAAFTTSTAAARADVMRAGTWDGRITSGTLSLGDAELRNLAVPGGDSFTFTIPAGTTAPVPFKASALHIPIPLKKEIVGDAMWAASGSLDLSPVSGTINPATGAVSGSATAHGVLRLDRSVPSTPGLGSSIYCQVGDTAPSADDPTAPAPFAVSLAGATAAGAATLSDTTFAVNVNCGAPFITPDTDLAIVGHPVMPSGTNALSLTASFTRRPDPKPPAATITPPVTTPTVTTPTVTPAVVKCLVPKLKGMKLKQARKAAKKANCAVGKVKRKKSSRKATTVIKQGAPVGAILAQGSKIRLTVAR